MEEFSGGGGCHMARGRGRGTGELFNGYSFRFVRQSSGKHLQNTVNTINATELYT